MKATGGLAPRALFYPDPIPSDPEESDSDIDGSSGHETAPARAPLPTVRNSTGGLAPRARFYPDPNPDYESEESDGSYHETAPAPAKVIKLKNFKKNIYKKTHKTTQQNSNYLCFRRSQPAHPIPSTAISRSTAIPRRATRILMGRVVMRSHRHPQR